MSAEWTRTDVTGLEARYGDDGLVYTRITPGGAARMVELDLLQQMAAGSGGADPWTPDLARAVLHALRLDNDQ
ncbi:hypothetical protein ACWGHA_03260 [Streptomyces xanthophaeus]